MQRRAFIRLLGGAAASPLVVRAQQPAKMKRIAVVHPTESVANLAASDDPVSRAFFEELSHAGWREGKNLVVERYSAAGQPDRFAPLAREVVDTHPDAIYAISSFLALAFKAATTTIPIVTLTSDPVAAGLVSNIARPGGNVTGGSVDTGFEIWGKRIGLLKEALPKLSNIFLIAEKTARWEGPFGSAVRQAATAASIALNAAFLDGKLDEAAYQRVFAAFEQYRPDALLISDYGGHISNAPTIVGLSAKHRLPAMYARRAFVEIGGLMSYGADIVALSRSIGYQMGQILHGTDPGDIPFNQITRLDLALNLKTAKSLGLEFPATLLGSADLIVE
jgi:putative tryptophan/tyrosine transport system substrate-binding protein